MTRPKKKKNTRTDAALDAMRPYGFPRSVIRRHLKRLLRVYGDDNWFFIEENAYKVLLDAILEQVEQDQLPQHHQGDTDTDMGAGPSREVLLLTPADTETREGPDSPSHFNGFGGCDTALLTDGGSGCLSATGEGSDSNQMNLAPTTAVLETNGIGHVENTNYSYSPPEATHSPQATDGVKIRKRQWIDSDEKDGEVELEELEPMSLREVQDKVGFEDVMV